RAGPSDGVGVGVEVQDAQLAPVGQVIGGGVDADRAAERAQARLDSRYLRDHVADGLAAGQPEAGSPAPHVHGSGHDLRSAQAHGLAISGHDSSIRSTRTLARRRWLVHQGSAQATVRPTASTGIGGVAGPSTVAAVSHPPTTTVTALA